MATHQDFSVSRGRTGTIIVTVTGVSSWVGLVAKLFATDAIGNAPLITITGTIDGAQNKITFSYVATDTDEIEQSSLYYEIVLYNVGRSYVKTTDYGLLNIAEVIKIDPTT
jgi:hypothetical protein